MIRTKMLLTLSAALLLMRLPAQQATPREKVNYPPGGAVTRASKQGPRKKGMDAAEKERLLEAVRATARKAAAAALEATKK